MHVIHVNFIGRVVVSQPLTYSISYETGKAKDLTNLKPKRVSKPRAKAKKGAANV